MGGMLGAIEVEEKELRLKEKRNDILQMINEIDDIDNEEGLQDLKYFQKKFDNTYIDPEAGDDESAAT